jgi:hypothetical protein
MQTAAGRKLAEERQEFLNDFFEQLDAEARGEG